MNINTGNPLISISPYMLAFLGRDVWYIYTGWVCGVGWDAVHAIWKVEHPAAASVVHGFNSCYQGYICIWQKLCCYQISQCLDP